VVNCTSIGFNTPNDSPLSEGVLQRDLVVMDAVFIPVETMLLRQAAASGCVTIQGVRMLLHQACGQVELYTGHEAPLAVMEKVIQREIEKMGD
jgi:shikimate dehydrogenase